MVEVKIISQKRNCSMLLRLTTALSLFEKNGSIQSINHFNSFFISVLKTTCSRQLHFMSDIALPPASKLLEHFTQNNLMHRLLLRKIHSQGQRGRWYVPWQEKEEMILIFSYILWSRPERASSKMSPALRRNKFHPSSIPGDVSLPDFLLCKVSVSLFLAACMMNSDACIGSSDSVSFDAKIWIIALKKNK